MYTPFRLKFLPTMAIGMDTILVENMHIKKYPFRATSLQQNLVYTSHNIYNYSKKNTVTHIDRWKHHLPSLDICQTYGNNFLC